jgi:DNA protecting protein DprA
MKSDQSPAITPAVEEAVGISLNELSDLYLLNSLKGFGPQKFKTLRDHGKSPTQVIANPELLPIAGTRGERFRMELKDVQSALRMQCSERAQRQILAAAKHQAQIITYSHPEYPHNVYVSNNPIPVLYVRGALGILTEQQIVACVGSRKTKPPYSELLRSFTLTAVEKEFAIVSGFAVGADILSHRTAVDASGGTICVMPSGLDRPFPPENKETWHSFLTTSRAVFVSEFPFGSRASALNLRKRNKLTVAFSLGVLVAQSAKDGGSMNAYRFAREQRKPVATFSSNSLPETSGNELISAAAIEGDATFSLNPDESSYEQWLRALLPSI